METPFRWYHDLNPLKLSLRKCRTSWLSNLTGAFVYVHSHCQHAPWLANMQGHDGYIFYSTAPAGVYNCTML